MELRAGKSLATARPTRLLCYCGKVLDTFVVNDDTGHFYPRKALKGAEAWREGQGGRYAGPVERGVEVTGSGFKWRCRPCGAVKTVRGPKLTAAYTRAVSEGRDVAFGVDC